MMYDIEKDEYKYCRGNVAKGSKREKKINNPITERESVRGGEKWLFF